MLVDSHCHLDYPDFAEEGVPQILLRAQDAGVGHFLTICTHVSKFDAVMAVAQSSSLVHCTVGTHPHHAAEPEEKDIPLSRIVELAAHEKVAGIGETGLDYYYDHSPRQVQQDVFARHVEAAVQTGLPLVIHSRDAEEDTIAVLKEAGQGRATGVMHCFSGSPWLAQAALDIGFYISFSGILTFKKSEELRQIAKDVPLNRLLVETDSPYLAPMPHRGKRNEPAFVAHTALQLAQVHNLTRKEMASITTDNFFTLFPKAKSS